MKTYDNLFNPDVYFFVIYVNVLCEAYCNPDASKNVIHIYIRLYVPVDFMHDMCSFHHFSNYVICSFTLPSVSDVHVS